MPRQSDETERIGIHNRIPLDLWRDMKKLAVDRRSTLNDEVVAALERHVQEARRGMAESSRG